jgi:hypothetical protein
VRRGKEALDQGGVGHHRAPGIHEQEHLGIVLTRWAENEFDLPAVPARLVNGFFQV